MEKQITITEFAQTAKKLFPDIKIIFEVGALNGNDSIHLKEQFPNAEIYTIEGLPENYEKFLKFFKNINTINRVITNYDGTITFFKKNINGIHGIFDRGKKFGREELSLPCSKLSTLCHEKNIKNIDLIKIDVEGATLEVLEGMEEILQTIKIMHIETESYPFFSGQRLHDSTQSFLIKNNFKMLNIAGVIIEKGGYQYDSIWIKET